MMQHKKRIAFWGITSVLLFTSSLTIAQQPILEEIVVTAQRREQNLQDVSISITAFSGEAINELGVTNLEELTQYVTSTELFDVRGAGQPTWVIRGVGLADFNANNTPTAAIYYDEYYLPSNVMGGIGLFDIDQVEILKGPQGGLYGRNSSGGAVRINSRRPTLDEGTNGYIKGSYGKWDRHVVEAALGTGLTDRLAVRIAATTDQDGGWQDTLATDREDDYGDRDFSALRAQLVYEPSDTLDLWLKLETGEDKTETTLAYSRAMYDQSGDFCAAAYSGSHNEQTCLTWSNLTNFQKLTPGENGTLPSEQDSNGSTVMSKPINALDNSWTGINFQLNNEFDAFTLTSITGYLDYENNQVYDFDGQELTLAEEDGKADLKSWSQELRLLSNGDGPLTWLAGAIYAEDEDDEDRLIDLSDNVLVISDRTRRTFIQESESWAAYGQTEYDLTDNWRLHGSLRYTDEEKDFKDATSKVLGLGLPLVNGVDKSVKLDDHWSGHVGVDWNVNDDVMVYVRITQGFKSGGFFGGVAVVSAELDPYENESVTSYETGFKSTLLDGTLLLNGAAFFYDYRDVQGFTQVLSDDEKERVLTKLGNLGDAEHTGAELDLVWAPGALPGLIAQASVAWLDAEITDSDTIGLDPGGVEVPIEGLDRGYAPEWSTALQLRYERNITERFIGAIQFDYSWRDDLVTENSTLTRLDYAASSVDSYELLNARLSLTAADDSWTVAVTGKNLTDEEYLVSASTDNLGSFPSVPGRPMHWVVEGTYRW
jgi:iron complex outermembrane receptor protein